jgi:arylsulfatase A-like enzyme
MIVAPGVKPGVCRSLVEFLDIYSTVTDLCGLPLPATVRGKSLQPLLADPEKTVHDSALTHVTRAGGMTGFSLRTERWRYIQWSDGNAELYDHDNDPGEWHNVVADPANAAALVDLKRQLAGRR